MLTSAAMRLLCPPAIVKDRDRVDVELQTLSHDKLLR